MVARAEAGDAFALSLGYRPVIPAGGSGKAAVMTMDAVRGATPDEARAAVRAVAPFRYRGGRGRGRDALRLVLLEPKRTIATDGHRLAWIDAVTGVDCPTLVAPAKTDAGIGGLAYPSVTDAFRAIAEPAVSIDATAWSRTCREALATFQEVERPRAAAARAALDDARAQAASARQKARTAQGQTQRALHVQARSLETKVADLRDALVDTVPVVVLHATADETAMTFSTYTRTALPNLPRAAFALPACPVPFRVCLNLQYLIDAIDFCRKTGPVTLQPGDGKAPLAVTGGERGMLVMPCR